MRVVLSRLIGSGIAHQLEHFAGALPRFLLRHLAMDADRLRDLVADLEDRVERRHRLLEDHGDVVAAHLAHLSLGKRGEVSSLETDFAAGDPPGCATSRMIDIAVTLLPHPDSPTSATASPRRTSNETLSTACTAPPRCGTKCAVS